jgi:hypothetical protein
MRLNVHIPEGDIRESWTIEAHSTDSKRYHMKRYVNFIFAAFLLLAFWQGCYYEEILPDLPPPGEELSFSDEIIPIFNSSCNTSGCHATGDIAPDLSAANAYQSLLAGDYIDTDNPEQSELYQWLSGNRRLSMPLSGPDATINATVLLWIEQGAQNN